MLFSDDAQSRYYTIGEVADLLRVKKSLIRFWETEFEELAPQKNNRGERRFSQEDIDLLQHIYRLVKDRGFTLAGAKKELAESRIRQSEKQKVIKRLKELKFFLQKLRPED